MSMLALVPHQVHGAHVLDQRRAVFRPPAGDGAELLNARTSALDHDHRPAADERIVDTEQLRPHHVASPKA